MKILAIADIHGNLDVYRWILLLVEKQNIEAVVLAGDLLGFDPGFKTPEEAQFANAKKILGILDKITLPVLYIMGNDDLLELPCPKSHMRSLHGCRVEIGAYNFLGYQYSLPFVGGSFEKTESEIKNDLTGLKPLVDSNTVFVTHSPAWGILDEVASVGHVGSKTIREFIEETAPQIHIHGHIHECYNRAGKHVNAASRGEKKAFVIDLASGYITQV